MKVFIFLALICTTARAQSDSTNPYNIAQPHTIILHHTDVYYNPFAPPPDTTAREALCNLANTLTDSNGIEEPGRTPSYRPTIDTFRFGEWHPHGTQIGWNTTWQRLFTARRKADGTPSDIFAGSTGTQDSVIVSKNEDVDFRASGRIWLKSGFHVKPGAFFHAYTEPKWGAATLTDDFNGSHIDTTQWYVMNGHEGGGHNQCSLDTNAFISADSDAIDGSALDVVMREFLDTCNCSHLIPNRFDDECNGVLSTDTSRVRRYFSSAIVYACPWPFQNRQGPGPLKMAYEHMPYGKYEIREKIPHFLHHSNNWFYLSADYEMDFNEGYYSWQGQSVLNPSLHHRVPHGPYTGHFNITSTDTEFISNDAYWCASSVPKAIIIDNFAYNVRMKDTLSVLSNGEPLAWPRSLIGSSDPVTFYYTREDAGTSDALTWRIKPNASGKWRILAAPYHLRHLADHDSILRFSKDYQPSRVTLTVAGGDQQEFDCFWDSSINYPADSGFLYLRDTNGLDTSLYWTSNTEAFPYSGIREGISDYPGPAFELDWQGHHDWTYKYHTFSVEILPNEIRFLCDSNVVRRIPDRLVPQGHRMFDVASHLPRSGGNFFLSEFDMDNAVDGEGHLYDFFGQDSSNMSITYRERKAFELAASYTWGHLSSPWAGFDIYHGAAAAHHKIDYVRVWDVPAGTEIPNFPN